MKQKLTYRSLMAKWIHSHVRHGFSLVEVNMAIFVMAVGILSMAVLFPLGLRESNQGFADLKQASYADFLLNQAVAAAQMTNISWSQWEKIPMVTFDGDLAGEKDLTDLPDFIRKYLVIDEDNNKLPKDDRDYQKKFRIGCCRPLGYSGRKLAIVVQSTELKDSSSYKQYSGNPIYFAEAYFRGNPDTDSTEGK